MYSIRAKKEIQNFRKSINEFLDRLENEMDKQVSQMQASQMSKWMTTSKQIEKLDNDIKTIKRTKEQTRPTGQRCNSYINMKRNVHQLKQLEDQIVTVQKEIRVSEYNFKPDVNLQNIIKDTKTFGKLVTRQEDESGYLGSTTSTTSSQRSAQNPTNTSTQRDNSALIEALTQRKNCYSLYGSTHHDQYTDAIKSVKAGGRVDFGRLPRPFGSPALPRVLWNAYNKFHGY